MIGLWRQFVELVDIARLTLLLIRLGPLMSVVPLLPRGAPLLRMTLTVAFATVLYPLVNTTLPSFGTLPYLAACGHEVVVGAALALAVSVPFVALEHAGRLVEVARGAGQAEISMPTGERVPILAGGYHVLLVAAFASVGGLVWTVEAFARHVVNHPLGGVGLSFTELEAAARLIADTFELAVLLAAPMLGVLVLVDVALGLLARAGNGIPVFFVAMPLRALIGVAVVMLTAGATLPTVLRLIGTSLP